MDECFVCVEPASDRYSVTLERSKTLEKKAICDECVTDLQKEKWIEIHSEPVLASDGGGSQESERQ
jgi:hypothetical protein